jgi:hypothetical protein
MNEIHGYNKSDQMEIDDGVGEPAKDHDFLFGSSGPCILEEY